MWWGHDLRLLRSQIAGMLATVKGLGITFQTFQRGLETPAVNSRAHQSDRGSNQPICHGAVRAPGRWDKRPQAIWHQLASL